MWVYWEEVIRKQKIKDNQSEINAEQ